MKRKGNYDYNVLFSPDWIGNSEARFSLTNPLTNEIFDYQLLGIAEEPKSLANIIIPCKVRVPSTITIPLKSPHPDQSLQILVETDLINPSGEQSFTIEQGQSVYNYYLTVVPIHSGNYIGSITFKYLYQSTHRYFWYTVLVQTQKDPNSIRNIELISTVRQPMLFELKITNPLLTPAPFSVEIQGEALTGSTAFEIPPNENYIYTLQFLPLRAFNSIGSLVFTSVELGEISYNVRLLAENPPAMKVPTLRVELGKSEYYECVMENPTKFSVDVIGKVLREKPGFAVDKKISLPPFAQTSAKIWFTPTDIDISEQAEIIFSSSQIGNWNYIVYGLGLPPTQFPELIITSQLNHDSSTTIQFKNPFLTEILVTITLEESDPQQQAFFLLLKKTKLQIKAQESVQIPVSFLPREIEAYCSMIQIFMNEKIQWKYPIKGITESCPDEQFTFSTKSREKLETTLLIQLNGLSPQLLADPNLTFQLSFENIPNNSNNFDRIFKLLELHSNNSPKNHLKYRVQFMPMKPFRLEFDIVVIIPCGAKWRYKTILVASEPDIDDIITLHSKINQTKTVSFKLQNRYKNSTHFQAFFTADSDPEFQVTPSSGTLEPYGKDGNTFFISFSPSEYGKIKSGKLIIETEELYWSYIVKGALPIYNSPNSIAKVNSTLDKKFANKLKSFKNKNFIINNIEFTKSTNYDTFATTQKFNQTEK